MSIFDNFPVRINLENETKLTVIIQKVESVSRKSVTSAALEIMLRFSLYNIYHNRDAEG